MRQILRIGGLAVGVLAGCALHEASTKPPVLPAAFEARPAGGDSSWPSQDWYRGFGSQELQTLIEQAANNNLDLAMAKQRVTQADARARQAGAAILPNIEAGANGNYLAGHSANGSAHETDWAVLLSASYEIDFWGKNRATARSAVLLAEASRADRDTLALTALAGVADGYFQVLSLRERLTIATGNVDAAKKLLDVIQARFNEGMANPVELSAQKAVLATAALVVPGLKQQEGEARASLAVLLGRAPEQFSIAGDSLDSLVEPSLGSGIPAELLTRRPDVFMAEANLQAANANLVAARAALLPSLNLTVSGGVQNPALNAAVITLSGVGPTLNLGASIVQTIFDGGRLRAMRTEAQARDEELVIAYRAAILAALVDVENALSALNHLGESRAFQLENVAQSELAFEGATLRYKAGSGDFLTVLEAQRLLYAARDQYSQYKLARLEASVALCKALGGGWQAQSPALSTKETR
jgi:NodT family efflux transporter outer membrane factor (OMF) lipoprotein